MIARHYAFAEWCAYVERESDEGDRTELEGHLAACLACRRLADDVRAMLQMLRDPVLWPILRDVDCSFNIAPEVASSELDELLHFADRLAAEQLDAAVQFRSLLLTDSDDSSEALMVPIPKKPTAGAVTCLLDEARRVRPTTPEHALALVTLAVELAKALPAEAYPARHTFVVRGQAYRDRGATLLMLGRENEAADALDRADAALRQVPAAELELALVEQVRATMLLSAGRVAEGLRLIRRALQVFGKYSDLSNFTKARAMEAAVLGRSAEMAVATAIGRDGVAVPAMNE